MRAQRRPDPRIEEGLAAARFASAAIDVSDGFLQDLCHLCRASGIGAEIECSRIPIGRGARAPNSALEMRRTAQSRPASSKIASANSAHVQSPAAATW